MTQNSKPQNDAPEAQETDVTAAETEVQDAMDEAGTEEATEAAEIDDATRALAQELAETRDKLLRAVAEIENVRKRADRDREQDRKFGIANFAGDVAGVADDLRRALSSVPAEAAHEPAVKALMEGVEMTERTLLTALEKHGVRRVAPEPGEPFDYNYHQAMFEVENSGQPAGTVVQLLQPGYVIHDRLLKAAMVGVAKGESRPADRIDTSA
ncbi:nucleotide exchange factor GrpE [Hoeflea sp.]|uniref:nucleotide exchange factor GrpE n=1 Tax=Hoeflea sp. TaxID=1940281 RepID=UPI0019C0732A|nr:nucleotide exchange factor GrpE [Hoeflea sp.]MBC7286252.1 nucleotide exchange factor GrpE [Hoeflea sp.]